MAKKTVAKKQLKENKKPNNADPDLQDQDGANPSLAGEDAPKKKSKK